MNEGLCQISNFNIQFLETVSLTTAQQRQITEISKQIFPEREYRGLSPNFHIHASVSDLYISTMVCLFCWRKYVDRSRVYINLLKTHECGNWGWGRSIPRNGIHKWDFRCSVKTGRDDPVFLESLHRCMKTLLRCVWNHAQTFASSCAILVRLSLSVVILYLPRRPMGTTERYYRDCTDRIEGSALRTIEFTSVRTYLNSFLKILHGISTFKNRSKLTIFWPKPCTYKCTLHKPHSKPCKNVTVFL